MGASCSVEKSQGFRVAERVVVERERGSLGVANSGLMKVRRGNNLEFLVTLVSSARCFTIGTRLCRTCLHRLHYCTTRRGCYISLLRPSIIRVTAAHERHQDAIPVCFRWDDLSSATTSPAYDATSRIAYTTSDKYNMKYEPLKQCHIHTITFA
jgi:hypothetical protein